MSARGYGYISNENEQFLNHVYDFLDQQCTKDDMQFCDMVNERIDTLLPKMLRVDEDKAVMFMKIYDYILTKKISYAEKPSLVFDYVDVEFGVAI